MYGLIARCFAREDAFFGNVFNWSSKVEVSFCLFRTLNFSRVLCKRNIASVFHQAWVAEKKLLKAFSERNDEKRKGRCWEKTVFVRRFFGIDVSRMIWLSRYACPRQVLSCFIDYCNYRTVLFSFLDFAFELEWLTTISVKRTMIHYSEYLWFCCDSPSTFVCFFIEFHLNLLFVKLNYWTSEKGLNYCL